MNRKSYAFRVTGCGVTPQNLHFKPRNSQPATRNNTVTIMLIAAIHSWAKEVNNRA